MKWFSSKKERHPSIPKVDIIRRVAAFEMRQVEWERLGKRLDYYGQIYRCGNCDQRMVLLARPVCCAMCGHRNNDESYEPTADPEFIRDTD